MVKDILLKIRDVLADHQKQRWSDDTLLRLLNEGINNFILQTKTLKLRSYIPIETNKTVYDMSPYASSIDRVQYMDQVLIAKTEEEMDRYKIDWLSDEGETPKFVIFDNLKQGSFRLYPKIVGNTINNIVQNQVYGGLIDVDINESLYMNPQFSSAAFQGYKQLIVCYVGKPNLVDLESTEIEIDNVYEPAIVAYVSGQALRLDSDTLNRDFGAEQLSIYKGYVDQAKSREAESNNTFINREIHYRGFV